jgi:hypothetical protein
VNGIGNTEAPEDGQDEDEDELPDLLVETEEQIVSILTVVASAA